jgi:FtsZ-binding cell division protein ZapB
MTTIEMQVEHLTKQNAELKAEVSRLQGKAHGLMLENKHLVGERDELLRDVRTLQQRCQDNNIEINGLQERCCTCGIGGE